MNDAYSRHRPLALLASVVLFQVLLLAFQVKRANDVRLVRYWAVEIVSPVERAGTWFFSKIGGVWSGYVGLRNAKEENAKLRSDLDRLQLRNRELESQAAEAQRLEVLLNFHESHLEAQMVTAQVIGASADPSSHTLFINRGERDRLRRNMAVITPDGIVGKTVEVFPTSAQVLLINDKDSGVGALFADSRTHGVVKGTGDPEPIMDYVANDDKVSAGETILTSGEDRIFPKGLLIGTVVDNKPGATFQTIHVKSATRLDRLEEVIVLLTQQELAPKKTDEITSTPIQAAPEPVVPAAAAAAAAANKAKASAAKPSGAKSDGGKPAVKPESAKPGAGTPQSPAGATTPKSTAPQGTATPQSPTPQAATPQIGAPQISIPQGAVATPQL
jgi:rod shape-determining protein MreC